MGLFDHLFKAKSSSDEEKVGEHAVEGSAVAKSAEGASRTQAPQRADPSAFLHPKNFVPRGAPGLTPAPRPSSAMSGKSAERRATSSGSLPAADEIVLTLGDVLSRIPTHYLKAGVHDAKRELRFKINDLSSDIGRGRAAVPLSRIAQLAPEIFVKEISQDEDTEVRLPLQKLVEQIGLLRSQPKTSVVEKIARPVTAAELPPMANPVVPIAARTAESIAVQSVVELISPAPGQPQRLPIVQVDSATLQKAAELKPAAEQAAAPMILGPAPVIESRAVPVAPVAPVPPEPESTQAIPEAKQPVETAAANSEPAPAMATPPPVAPPTGPEAHKIVIHWGRDAAAGAAGPESGTGSMAAGPGQIELPDMASRLTPVDSTQPDTGEESIQLSLAAILRNCPPEIVVKQLPYVDDSVRITLPFAPIDRQLVKGQVEVSALRFIAALPEAYQKYFVAKVGVKVPIPLEEVFQNLPTPTQELTSSPPMPPPVVLAPEAPAVAATMPPAAPAVAVASAAAPPEEKKEELPVPPAPGEPLAPEAPAVAATMPPAAPAVAVASAAAPPEEKKEELPAPPAPGEPLAPEAPAVAAMMPPAPLSQPMPAEPEVATAAAGIEPPAHHSATPTESPASVPAADLTPPPLPSSPAAEIAPAASGEPHQVAFHPPVFRPQFIPPPPIFRFTPPPQQPPEPEPAARPAPPSVLVGLTGADTPPPASTPLEASAAAAPVAEAVVAIPEPVVAPVPEAPAAEDALKVPVEEPPASVLQSGPPPLPDATAPQPHKAEAPPAAGSEAEPSADLIALAAEHAAPELVQFSSEPVPHADLAEMLAHETTYASDLAEVVHVDLPDVESGEPKAPVTVGQPQTQMVEHHAVPIIEGLAATAVAATLAEHAPLDFREIVAPTTKPESSGEPAVSAETHEVEKPGTGEPLIPDQPAPAAETAPPLAESIPEPEKAALAPETPEAPASEPSVTSVPPPPPYPLFPPPKLHAEPAHFEVVPPAALSTRRFNQDAVQALFMTEEALDLPKVSRLAAALPGVYACVIATRDQACTGGTLPDGFDLAALLGLAPRVGEAASRMPIGQLKHFTLYGDAYSVSFFERNGLSLCAVHRPRSFVPGVREKLVALADELSQ